MTFKFDMPDVIPVFPLPGALLLPRAKLPLHIFEPRYLQMLDDDLESKYGAKFDIVDTKKSDDIEDTPLIDVIMDAIRD